MIHKNVTICPQHTYLPYYMYYFEESNTIRTRHGAINYSKANPPMIQYLYDMILSQRTYYHDNNLIAFMYYLGMTYQL